MTDAKGNRVVDVGMLKEVMREMPNELPVLIDVGKSNYIKDGMIWRSITMVDMGLTGKKKETVLIIGIA